MSKMTRTSRATRGGLRGRKGKSHAMVACFPVACLPTTESTGFIYWVDRTQRKVGVW